MAHALDQLDLPLEGVHHRGIDDARNIARIARHVLPHVARTALDRMVDIADRSGMYGATIEPKRTR